MLRVIQKLPFKSFEKIKEHIRKKYSKATDQEIREVLNRRVKDRFIKMKEQRKSMIRIFSKAGKNHYNVIFVGKDGKDFHDKVSA